MKRKLMLLLTCLFIGIGLVTAQTQKITGVVISEEDGQPVVGASVLVKGTTIGTITDVDGNFTLSNVPSSAKTLQVSFIGMQSQEVAIEPSLKIIMKSDSQLVDEIVVIGYGSGKKLGSVVGSVATVHSETLATRPSSNFTDALQGQVAGLQVISSSGEPSSVSSMSIRGRNSINASNQPLFILDGAPISSTTFTSLNPNDIENITVLKDASSTAIYGSRAANGVIIITSKRAKGGDKATVTLRAQYGISQLTMDKVEMMNSEQYYQFQEMLDPTLATNQGYLANKKYTLDHGIDTNWRDYVYRDNAPTSQYDVTISGAGPNTNYYASFSHFDQTGIAAVGSNLRRENLRSNVDTKITDWLKFGANINLAYIKYKTMGFTQDPKSSQLSVYNSTSIARQGLPTQPIHDIVENEDGSWHYGDELNYLEQMGQYNPMFIMGIQPTSRSSAQVNANTFFQLTPIKGLTIRAAQAMDAFDYNFSYKMMPDAEANGGKGSAMELSQRNYAFTYTNTAEYKWSINTVNNFTVLGGQESIIKKSQYFTSETEGQTDERLMLLSAGTKATMPEHEILESTFNSYFGQADYNYDERYYLNASIRTDGSSLFGKDNRWATFYSVGAMWNLKNETFLSDVSWINDLRLKFSYGTTGNSGIAEYLAFGLVGNSKGYSYNNGSVIYTMNPSNPELSWETVKSTNVAVSTRLFDRLNLDVEFYNKQTENMLLNMPYSYTTGFSSGFANVGGMRNRGVDVTVGFDILNNNDFKWTVSTNFNYNKNEVTDLYGGVDRYNDPDYPVMVQIGKPYGSFYLVEWAGVDPRDGYNMWYDKNGNLTKTYTEENAQVLDKSWIAPWSGGLSTQFSWKGISVSADFSWMAQKYIMNIDRQFYENPKFSGNQSVKMLDMWQKPGDVTDIPCAASAMQSDTHLLENASFLRLKNLTISYSFPKSLLNKTGFINNVRVFAVGRNLLTFTKFNGYDPELAVPVSIGSYPNTRQYTGGVEITF